MDRRIIIGLCCLVMIAATLAVPDIRAQGDSGLKLVTELTMPGSNETKFPHAVASDGRVYISGNVKRSDAVYWTKADNALSFPEYTRIGKAGGQPDWSNTSMAVGPDKRIYYAWDDSPSRTIFMRTVDAAGNLGTVRVVDRGSSFPISVEVAVSTKNEIFVIWRDPDEAVKFRFSTDGGVNWSGRRAVSDIVAFASPLDIVAGPNGQVAVSFTAGSGGGLHVFTGLWDSGSSSFVVQRVTALGADYADSSITFTPDGTLYTAWRGVADSGGNAGVFYSERQPDGSWPRSRVIGDKVTGKVNIDSDETGNLHLAWIGQPSGGNQLFYAFKPAIDTFRGPIASGNTGAIFNPHAFASGSTNGIFDHVVMEWFSGGNLYTRYSLFQGQGAVYGASPLIEGGAAVVDGKTSVQVTFSNSSGLNLATTQVRWRWNAAPTDSANDSGGWKTYASTMAVPIPAPLLSATTCAESQLYTQLRDTGRDLIEDPAKSDAVLVDGIVQSTVDVHNPFINIANSLASSDALAAELALSKGAVGAGDVNYTRVPLIYLSSNNVGDCTGITSVSVGKSADAMEITYKSDGNGFSGFIPLPDLANLETGVRPVVVQTRDGAGNVKTSTFSITFDDVAPKFISAGMPTTTPNPSASILQDLSFTNVLVDDTYTQGGRNFWGVWLANSRTEVTTQQGYDSLPWVALPASGTGTSFTVKDWNLATGASSIPIEGTPTTTYIYVRFLDGAGNATAETPLKITLTSTFTRVRSYIPFVNR